MIPITTMRTASTPGSGRRMRLVTGTNAVPIVIGAAALCLLFMLCFVAMPFAEGFTVGLGSVGSSRLGPARRPLDLSTKLPQTTATTITSRIAMSATPTRTRTQTRTRTGTAVEWEVDVDQSKVAMERGSSDTLDSFRTLAPDKVKVLPVVLGSASKSKSPIVRCLSVRNPDRSLEVTNVDDVDKVYRILSLHMKLMVKYNRSFCSFLHVHRACTSLPSSSTRYTIVLRRAR